jgi:hypothetical protein
VKADSITILGPGDAALRLNITRLPSCNIDRLVVPCVSVFRNITRDRAECIARV